MPSTSVNTKVEFVTEAIEALVLAQVVAVAPSRNEDERALAVKNVGDARAVLSKSLHTLLEPTLRVVTNNQHRDICTPERCHCGSQ